MGVAPVARSSPAKVVPSHLVVGSFSHAAYDSSFQVIVARSLSVDVAPVARSSPASVGPSHLVVGSFSHAAYDSPFQVIVARSLPVGVAPAARSSPASVGPSHLVAVSLRPICLLNSFDAFVWVVSQRSSQVGCSDHVFLPNVFERIVCVHILCHNRHQGIESNEPCRFWYVDY